MNKSTLYTKVNNTKIQNADSSENLKSYENHKETTKTMFELEESIHQNLNKNHPTIVSQNNDKITPKVLLDKLRSEFPISPESYITPINTEEKITKLFNNNTRNPNANFNKSGLLNNKTTIIPATISSNLTIKRIPTEELSKTLSNIINHLIPFIDINKVFPSQSKILDEIVFSNYEHAHQISEYLKSYKCNNCKSESPKIQLSCKHSFCESCTNSFKIISSIENPNHPTLLCSICTKPITENEYNLLFLQNNEKILNFENDFLLEKLNTQGFLKCCICNKNKNKYYQTSCYHMCKDCVAENIRLKKFQCSICIKSFTNIENILYEIVLCDNCQIKGYYIGDYMKSINGGKCTLCSLCLNKSLNQGMCEKCGKKVSKIDKIKINDFLFIKCEVCGEDIFRGYVNFNSCCGLKVCMRCKGDYEGCMKCGF
ncbi:hypothetical protein SteCoe_34634 [Stentor coeruleus]|uniref:RING-type domain-containing protein n=1 Tax=Stentor coeruleus TaxID=5963 RepID=A0A1R2AU27_9CILI|nr:hypothetical protein SteCoe_34634 [Stentor coeruleus]